jgi:hypothetical protein
MPSARCESAVVQTDDATPTVRLERWIGPWAQDDPNAAFKAEVADYTLLDPLETLRGLADFTGVPEGALARYVLAKWACAGNEALLEIGPGMVERLWQTVAAAEADGGDPARLEAYHVLRGMLSWLRSGSADSE